MPEHDKSYQLENRDTPMSDEEGWVILGDNGGKGWPPPNPFQEYHDRLGELLAEEALSGQRDQSRYDELDKILDRVRQSIQKDQDGE